MSHRIRTFFAVELQTAWGERLAGVLQDLKAQLASGLSRDVRISWARPGSLHVTLKFLGDVDEGLVDPLRSAIAPVMAEHRPIEIPLTRFGAFPCPQEPRVLWVGPPAEWASGADARRIAAVHRAIDDGCAAFGIARDDRPFGPHLTVARIKAGQRAVGRLLIHSAVLDRAIPVGPLSVTSIVLMKSELRPGGAVHTRLWETALQASA